jgi:hypothetical protein
MNYKGLCFAFVSLLSIAFLGWNQQKTQAQECFGSSCPPETLPPQPTPSIPAVIPLNRFYFSPTQDSTDASVLTFPPPQGFFVGTVGYVLSKQEPGTVPLFRCVSFSDNYLTRDPNCEFLSGAVQQGIAGFAYSAPPANVPNGPLFRCVRRKSNPPRGVSAFDSYTTRDSKCEGMGNLVGSLGAWVRLNP